MMEYLDIVDLGPVLTRLWYHPQRNAVVVAASVVLVVVAVAWRAFLAKTTTQQKKKQQTKEEAEEWREGDHAGEEDDEECEEDAYDEEVVAHVPYRPQRFPADEMVKRAREFYKRINERRSCRVISSDPVPREVIENVIRAAGTSPSGAHTQPWTFVVVADPEMKKTIRETIEAEEYINYTRRMGEQWVKDLQPLKTNWNKPYLTEAPYIILLFRRVHGYKKDGRKQTNYYGEISTAISAGFLLLAIHHAGLVTVTTTPMNCGPSLRQLLQRPNNEKLMLLFPVGLPPADAHVPDLKRKPLDDYLVMV